MKHLFFLLILSLSALLWSQPSSASRGKAPPSFCGQLKNSYGYGDTTNPLKRRTNEPWRFKVDTVFVDTTGNGTYKKLGTGVAGVGDTTRAVSLRSTIGAAGPLGFFNFAGFRTAANDSGAFAMKPLCYSLLAKSWVTWRNVLCDTLTNLKCDSLLLVPKDTAGFLMERYLPSQCDSMKVVLYSSGVTGRSPNASDPIKLKRLGLCAD